MQAGLLFRFCFCIGGAKYSLEPAPAVTDNSDSGIGHSNHVAAPQHFASDLTATNSGNSSGSNGSPHVTFYYSKGITKHGDGGGGTVMALSTLSVGDATNKNNGKQPDISPSASNSGRITYVSVSSQQLVSHPSHCC
jgi:hypothetical protein